jgi:8-oxo-dGTP pyrophosphatase MutT (NUDIX family)
LKELCVGSIQAVLGTTRAVESFDVVVCDAVVCDAVVFDAVVVVLFSSGKLVLVRNARRAWEFPGGHREGNESYEETAAREAYEEAGAKITDIEYLGYYVTPAGHVTVITCAEVSSFQGPGDEYETSEVGILRANLPES